MQLKQLAKEDEDFDQRSGVSKQNNEIDQFEQESKYSEAKLKHDYAVISVTDPHIVLATRQPV